MKSGVLLDLQVADLVVCTDVDVMSKERSSKGIKRIIYTRNTHSSTEKLQRKVKTNGIHLYGQGTLLGTTHIILFNP